MKRIMFSYKVYFVSAIVVLAQSLAEPPSSYGPPGYTSNFNKVTTTFTGGSSGSVIPIVTSSGSTGGGSSVVSFTGGESGAPEPYSYVYEVKDAPSGNDFSALANSDGKRVTGEYRVLLPDGRRQIVKYTADDGGYNANVQYEGQARYPVTPVKPAVISTGGGAVITSTVTGGSTGTGTIIAGGSSGSSTFSGYRY